MTRPPDVVRHTKELQQSVHPCQMCAPRVEDLRQQEGRWRLRVGREVRRGAHIWSMLRREDGFHKRGHTGLS